MTEANSIGGVNYPRGTTLFAKEASTTFNALHWVRLDDYISSVEAKAMPTGRQARPSMAQSNTLTLATRLRPSVSTAKHRLPLWVQRTTPTASTTKGRATPTGRQDKPRAKR